MAGDDEKIHLPTGPANLCFNKDDFMKESFSVDDFVFVCRKQVPLETLRDDLNVYLQILRSAMVELINKDYADFVNLSTNLVGLDKVIGNLVTPIGQLKEEILTVKSAVDETALTTKEKLAQRQEIREKKACLHHLINISNCVCKIEQLLAIPPTTETDINSTNSRELTGDLIERVATEFNQLHFYVTKSKGHVFIEKIKPRIINITRVLQTSLEESFVIGLAEDDLEQLSRCLRIYATIDRMKEVEDLFRKHVVQPFMNDVVKTTSAKAPARDLKCIYDQVLAFIPQHCTKLKNATKRTANSEPIQGYDFVVNAVWPEMVSAIERHLTFIFAPANPDLFHERYTITMNFMEQFEQLCGSQLSVKRLREHGSYSLFTNKWNLPVYFQIRFQDIGGTLENALMSPWKPAVSGDFGGFALNPSSVLWSCLIRTWSDEVYLPQLCHRFWKLSLQLVSRYSEWVHQVSTSELDRLQPSNDESSESASAAVTPAAGESSNKQSVNGVEAKPDITLSLVTLLVTDVQLIIGKLTTFCEETARPQLQKTGFEDMSVLTESLKESQYGLSSLLPSFSTFVEKEIFVQCAAHLKHVNDIPRLYRKTNREVPSKPSSYLTSLLQPLEAYRAEYKSTLPAEFLKQWSVAILTDVTRQYYTMTSNVLTSVRKMEESLSRLKKARDKGNSALSGSSSGMTDDDKIRHQLVLDVENYGKQIESFGFPTAEVDSFASLVELVETARNSPNRTS